MPITKVALLGGQGRLGAWILTALQEQHFKVTVLRRESSSATYPPDRYPGLAVCDLPDDYVTNSEACVAALKGHDALVIAIPGGKVKEQIALADACVKAGVARMVPADYGSLSSDDPVVLSLVPIFEHKQQVRHHLQELASFTPAFSWTSLVCGHFIDYVLESPRMLHYDLSRRHASIFDSGDERWSACTRTRVGEAVAKILSPQFEQRTRNRMIFMHSFAVTQNAILGELKRVGELEGAAGGEWTVERGDMEAWIEEKHKVTKEVEDGGEAFWHATEELVGVLGMKRANWEDEEDFMNREFGFEDEDLGEVVELSWKKVNGK